MVWGAIQSKEVMEYERIKNGCKYVHIFQKAPFFILLWMGIDYWRQLRFGKTGFLAPWLKRSMICWTKLGFKLVLNRFYTQASQKIWTYCTLLGPEGGGYFWERKCVQNIIFRDKQMKIGRKYRKRTFRSLICILSFLHWKAHRTGLHWYWNRRELFPL